MTSLVERPQANAPITLERAQIKSWKIPIALTVFVLIGVILFVVLGRDGQSTFGLSRGSDLIQLPPIVLPTRAACIVIVVVLAAIAAWSAYLASRARKAPLWSLALFGFLFVVCFLTWASAGSTLPVSGLLIGTLGISVPACSSRSCSPRSRSSTSSIR